MGIKLLPKGAGVDTADAESLAFKAADVEMTGSERAVSEANEA